MNTSNDWADEDSLAQPKVLLVDDDEVNLLLTSIALRERGDEPDETAIWEHLRAVIVDQIGVPLEDVTRNARFIQDLNVD